jgi:excisionase family DNA binding protein
MVMTCAPVPPDLSAVPATEESRQRSNLTFTVPEVAEKLRVSVHTVYRLIKRGELRKLTGMDCIRIPAADFERYLKGRG